MIRTHIAPDPAALVKNKKAEPEGERIRAELVDFLRRNQIVTVRLDTDEHQVQVDIAKLPSRIKPVLTKWGSIYVKDDGSEIKRQTTFDYDNSQALSNLQDKYDDALSLIDKLEGHVGVLKCDVLEERTKLIDLKADFLQLEQYNVDGDGDGTPHRNGEWVKWEDVKELAK